MQNREGKAKAVGLPVRPFLYTLSQIADMLAMKESTLKKGYCYFYGIHTTAPNPDKLKARNIAPQGERPEWRVAEKELIRWLKRVGFRVTERGWVDG